MKLFLPVEAHSGPRRRRHEEASSVIVVLALLSLILVYVAFNARTVHLLHRNVQLVERQQLRRLAEANASTNVAPRLSPPKAGGSTNSPAPPPSRP